MTQFSFKRRKHFEPSEIDFNACLIFSVDLYYCAIRNKNLFQAESSSRWTDRIIKSCTEKERFLLPPVIILPARPPPLPLRPLLTGHLTADRPIPTPRRSLLADPRPLCERASSPLIFSGVRRQGPTETETASGEGRTARPESQKSHARPPQTRNEGE